jgi:hypothetical protein
MHSRNIFGRPTDSQHYELNHSQIGGQRLKIQDCCQYTRICYYLSAASFFPCFRSWKFSDLGLSSDASEHPFGRPTTHLFPHLRCEAETAWQLQISAWRTCVVNTRQDTVATLANASCKCRYLNYDAYASGNKRLWYGGNNKHNRHRCKHVWIGSIYRVLQSPNFLWGQHLILSEKLCVYGLFSPTTKQWGHVNNDRNKTV